MSIKFTSFDSMTKQNKITALMHVKEQKSQRKDDYYLTLHAMLSNDTQVCLAAKMVSSIFKDQPFFLDLSGLTQDEVKEKVGEFMRQNIGFGPEIVALDSRDEKQLLSQELQKKQKKYDLLKEWDGNFPPGAAILNTLRRDTQELIRSALLKDEEIERTYICFYNETLEPFKDLNRSLDSNSATTVVNLSRIRNPGQISPALEGLFSNLERPIYLLALFSSKRGFFFLRDSLRTSNAAITAFNFQQVINVKTTKDGQWTGIEIETPQDLLKFPMMEAKDAHDASVFLREKSVESIEAEEGFIERDFEKELKKLDMLFKAKALKNSEYIFRKSRLQKMELEKFSDANIELLLAKRFSNSEMGESFDQQLLNKFTFEKTIMFTDIVGFSLKASEKRLLDTMTLLAVHDKLLMPMIEKYEGVLIKKIGDALMVRFDDPCKACLAAKEMQDRLNDFNRKSKEKIFIRIGLNTGTVFVKNDDAFGDAVNVAARMESLAKPGRIFLTKKTFELVKEDIKCELLGEFSIKGKPEPIEVFSIIDQTNQYEMEELAAKVMEGIGKKVNNAQPTKSEPKNHLELMVSSIDSSITSYKNAVKQGYPRNGDLEDWFARYEEFLKPYLSKSSKN